MPPRQLLCVAEKPSVAKEAARILSNGHHTVKESTSPYNKNFCFEKRFQGENVSVVFTSISGHILQLDFPAQYRTWSCTGNNILFDAPLVSYVPESSKPVSNNIQNQARRSFAVFLWLDNDREGEGIAEEVEQICKEANPRLQFFRARFSGLSFQDITRAFNNPDQINRKDASAVKLRSEMDLRTGAAFTRFQNQYKGRLQNADLISYGSCQFPTLGFVVKAFIKHKKHEPEPFWKIDAIIKKDDFKVELKWDRKRLFCRLSAFVLYDSIFENPTANILSVQEKECLSFKPFPLSTIELQKRASKWLKISSARSMKAAESLYQAGLISYPRTETDSFASDFKFGDIVNILTGDNGQVGQYANKILNAIVPPRVGKHSDNAHPPIYPLKTPDQPISNPDQKKVYDLVCRHFLACCSRDGRYMETRVSFNVGGEKFHTKGIRVIDQGWHEIYPFVPLNGKQLPNFVVGERVEPASIKLNQGTTTPPPLLTEPQLLKKMNAKSIGTDATYQDHIEKILERKYIIIDKQSCFEPTPLGLALYNGYTDMGFDFMKPNLRAELEQGLQGISSGQESFDVVRRKFIAKYKEAYEDTESKQGVLSRAFEIQKTNPYNAPLPSEGTTRTRKAADDAAPKTTTTRKPRKPKNS